MDLATELPDETRAEIRAAPPRPPCRLLSRAEHIDAEGQLAFARGLGRLTRAHPTLPASSESSARFDLDSQAGAAANHWHTDVTFVEQPPTFSILRAIVIPEIGGDTLWANTVAGDQDLRPSIRARANELRAVHTNGQDYGRVDVAKAKGRLRPEELEHLKTFVSTVYETEHPVV